MSARAARRAHLHVARARALQPAEYRRQPPAVRVGGVDLSLIGHHARERERLAAGAGAEIERLHAGLGAGKQRRELRAFVLYFDQALDVAGLGGERDAAPVGPDGDAQADRRQRRRDRAANARARRAPWRARPSAC